MENYEEAPVQVSERYRPAPRKPSDLLQERGALLRYSCGREAPTIDDLMRHAEKYGSDCVVETAAELGYGLDACIRLMEYCDRADALAYQRDHSFSNSKKLMSSEKRCRLLLGLEDEATEVEEV